VENFGAKIFANAYSEPADGALSSGAMVTAAGTVQKCRHAREMFAQSAFLYDF
jgi:hypothetical protein